MVSPASRLQLREMDGFIVPDGHLSEDEGGGGRPSKRKRRGGSEDPTLEHGSLRKEKAARKHRVTTEDDFEGGVGSRTRSSTQRISAEVANERMREYAKSREEKKARVEMEAEEDDAEETGLSYYNPILRELTPDARTIIGREEESQRIAEMMMQPFGGIRPILIGPAGIGKTSIVRKVAGYLNGNPLYRQWGNLKVFKLDCTELIASQIGQDYIECVGELLKEMVEETYKFSSNAIIYFKDIEKLMELEQVSEYVQTLFAKSSFFIASMSCDVKDEGIAKSLRLLANHNFQKLETKEAPLEVIHQIVINFLKSQPLNPKARLDDEAIYLAVRLAHKYEHERPNPIKSVNLIHSAANRVLMREPEKREVHIKPEHIAEYVSSNVGIAAEELVDSAKFDIDRFQERIKRQIVCQDEAVEVVSKRVARYKKNYASQKKPWGVFLFIGPTGVGKTELAKNLAQQLFHDERFVFKIDGSGYREEQSFATLIGSPSGYVGYESGGILTNALKANPHQVVIFDEFEKMHPSVRNLLLQIADDGRIADKFTGFVDCKETVFIATSNIGSEELFDLSDQEDFDASKVKEVLIPLLAEELRPELLARFKAVVPFQPLKVGHLPDVIKVQLRKIKERLESQANIELLPTKQLVDFFANCSFDLKLGMRKFCDDIDDSIEDALLDFSAKHGREPSGKVVVTISEGDKPSVIVREKKK